MLPDEQFNDVHYVCALIEYTARETGNFPVVVAKAMGVAGVRRQLELASVNHCLTFEEVSDELVTMYHIPTGDRRMDAYKYELPYYLDIGYLYADLVEDVCPAANSDAIKPDMDALDQTIVDSLAQTIYDVFTSFLSTEISNFDSSLYYSGREYLKCCYEDGEIIKW